MKELTPLEKELFKALTTFDFGSVPKQIPLYQINRWIEDAKAAAALCEEKIRLYCHSAFFHKDVASILPFEYTDDNFESWAKNNLKERL